ncbi:MAG: HU family DNA-binding protein [Muribaculaceae bacterium]|nr:HU family DNA-binding protein [Muribaculaceae bacterium]
MNSKITFPELIELIAESTNTSKRMSELFLKELFATVSQALIDGESVRIKNLGQFKLETVKPRKSVSVNTGKVVEIPSHNRLVFVPAKVLSDKINEPFAHFDTVVLDDAVTDEMLAAVSGDVADDEVTVVAPVAAPLMTPPVAQEEVEAEEPAGNEEVADAPVDEEPVVQGPPPFMPFKSEPEVTPPVVEPEEEQIEIPQIPSPEELEEDEPEQQEELAEMPVEEPEEEQPEAEPTPEVDDEEPAEEPVEEPAEVEDDDEPVGEPVYENEPYAAGPSIVEIEREKRDIAHRSLVKGLLFGAGAMLAVVLIALGAYWLGARQCSHEGGDAAAPAGENAAAPAVAPAGPDTIIYADDESQNAGMETAVSGDVQEADQVSEPEPEPKEHKVVTDVCTEDMPLTRLAKKHYGKNDFWVYIYEENKKIIDNPNRIKSGTVVVIPPAEKYGIDADDSHSVSKAEKKSKELFTHFANEELRSSHHD